MDDSLKAAIDRARAAGMTGLVCGVCDGEGWIDRGDGYSCPACDGTGYPSAAEVLLWCVLIIPKIIGRGWWIGPKSASAGWPHDSNHDGTPDGISGSVLRMTLDAMGVAP